MNTIKLKSGKEYACLACEVSPTMHILYVVLPSVGIQDSAVLFCDDAETSEIIFTPNEGEPKTFTGFTILVDIVPEPFGTRIGMRQPYIDEVY